MLLKCVPSDDSLLFLERKCGSASKEKKNEVIIKNLEAKIVFPTSIVAINNLYIPHTSVELPQLPQLQNIRANSITVGARKANKDKFPRVIDFV